MKVISLHSRQSASAHLTPPDSSAPDTGDVRDRFFELSPDLLCVAGLDGAFKRVNPSWEPALGFTAAKLQSSSLFDFVHPEDQALTTQALARLASDRRPILFEHRFRRRDGSYLWLQWNATPLPEQGLLYASARDVTDRRRAEQEIQKLAAFPRLNPHAVFEFAADGALSYFNDAALDVAQALGENHPARILPPDTAAIVKNCLALGQSRLHHETAFSGRTLSWSFFPIAVSQVVHCYASDVTERKHAEQRILEQAALLDKAQDAILVRDLEHRIIYWNKGAERIFGWSADEVMGKNCIELMSRKDGNLFVEALQAVLAGGEWSGELRQATKSGGEVIVESRWTLVRDTDGQPKSILALSTDITERKKLEAQFLRAQRLESIGTLASGIAHDLNNILAPIMMSVNLLQETLTDQRDARLLETLRASTQRGAEMVKQILSFTRGKDGARCLINLKHLISEVSKIVLETFPKKIQVKTSTAKDLWTVLADSTQLHQVLMNLCVNARDAMPDGGTLTIQAENVELGSVNGIVHNSTIPLTDPQTGSYLVLTVADTGTGIAPEIMEKIWEPFFTLKPQGQGTGLGLSTVLNIVKAHHGFIRTESDLGKGTRFRIFLPAAESAAKAVAAENAVAPPAGHGENILVIDDERAFQEITKAIFNKYGYRVLTANDGTEAVALFAQHKDDIDLVMTDMVMPYLDGPATITALRRIDPHVRIVAASGLSENERLAHELPHTTFLLKPFTTEKLLATVHQALRPPALVSH
jgi:PAS domain S-box-containing protein